MRICLSLIICCAVLCPAVLRAQQTQQQTQYIFNHFGYNPAVAGSRECIDIRTGVRKQWFGLEASPLTLYLSAYGRLARKKASIVKGYHGVGVYLQRDDQGPVSRTTLYPAYAYHLRLRKGMNLGFGVFGGLQQYRFDPTRLFVPDAGDPVLSGANSVIVVPDVSAGLWLYSRRVYWGFSALQLWRKPIRGFGGSVGNEAVITPHFNLTGGFQVEGNSAYYLVPSFMLKFSPVTVPALDLNVMFNYRRDLGVGLSYRNFDALAAIVRIRLLNFMNLGYSFDFTTSALRHGSSNTHEITLSIYTCGSRGSDEDIYTCPAYQ